MAAQTASPACRTLHPARAHSPGLEPRDSRDLSEVVPCMSGRDHQSHAHGSRGCHARARSDSGRDQRPSRSINSSLTWLHEEGHIREPLRLKLLKNPSQSETEPADVTLTTINVDSDKIRGVGAGVVFGDWPRNCVGGPVGPDSAKRQGPRQYLVRPRCDCSRLRRGLDRAELRSATQVRKVSIQPVAGGLIRLPRP